MRHGDSQRGRVARLYRIWIGVRNRCNNPNNKNYKEYGGRGILVCKEWDSYERFKEWAINSGYKNNLTIDRIDVNGNYNPSNCRWTTRIKQMNNTRINHLVSINNETYTLIEWCRKLNLHKTNVYCVSKKLGIPPEIYLEFKYQHRNLIANKNNIQKFMEGVI